MCLRVYYVISGSYFRAFFSRSLYQKVNSSQLATAYNPDIELKIRNKWKSNEPTKAEYKSVFSMILPPPNITGSLHLGHALTITIQDVIARWKQMNGYEVCWVPGFDHAGLATQAIVERSLLATQGLSRQQLGKEKLLEELWAWKREKRQSTLEQIQSLGSLLEWKRELFTLDKEQRESVANAIWKLWEEGLIYRESTLINWCCHLGSVLSDIEVTNVSITGPTSLKLPGQQQPVIFGRLMTFAYPVQGHQDEVVVATTRPETIPGDVAVAVHPSDQRYFNLHGCFLQHPLTGEAIPLILDEDVDPTFGTGALKITPAHDQLDYKIGKRNNLPLKQIFTEDGKLNAECGFYSDLNRWVAREKIIEDLARKGLLRSIDSHNMHIPICSRSGDVIELMLKAQWFIKCQDMAKKALDCVKEGQLLLEPEKYNNIWFSWMENMKDWCISRQIWWGHEAPFYYCSYGSDSEWICAKSQAEAITKGKDTFKSTDVTVTKDDDVLDTWFSSALLPFTAHGWPMQTSELRKYYPLSLMVTGNDILFFWVARMVMLGLQLTNQLPFKKVLLHGIICDSLGRKMSKSKGNVIDPLDIIRGSTLENLKNNITNYQRNGVIAEDEVQTALSGLNDMFQDGIPKCGADSLRFTLLSQKIKNTYVNFNVKDCHSNKHFCNKLWQATKFTLFWSEKLAIEGRNPFPIVKHLLHMDRWIIHRLSIMVDVLNKSLEMNEFHIGTTALKSFLYSDFCNVYIEYSKSVLKSDNKSEAKLCCEVLLFCLEISLRCLAPFMPHISEELYSKLPVRENDSVVKCTIPSKLQFYDNELGENVQEILNVVEAIRRMKSENGISSLKPVLVYIKTTKSNKLEQFKRPIQVLSRCLDVKISNQLPPYVTTKKLTKEIISENTDVYLELEEGSHTTSESVVGPKKLKLQKELDKLYKMRGNKGYENVPLEIQNAHSAKISKLNNKLSQLEMNIRNTKKKQV